MGDLEQRCVAALKAVRCPDSGKWVYEDAAISEDELSALARAIIPMVLEEAAKVAESFGPIQSGIERRENYSGEHRTWMEPINLPKGWGVFRDMAAAIRAMGAP